MNHFLRFSTLQRSVNPLSPVSICGSYQQCRIHTLESVDKNVYGLQQNLASSRCRCQLETCLITKAQVSGFERPRPTARHRFLIRLFLYKLLLMGSAVYRD